VLRHQWRRLGVCSGVEEEEGGEECQLAHGSCSGLCSLSR
jgi:hypothetical protein